MTVLLSQMLTMRYHQEITSLIVVLLCSGLSGNLSSWAKDAPDEFFEKKIRPVLSEHCIRCHGPDKVQGSLRLDTREGWQTGGDSGPAIVPGDEDSLILNAIEYEDADLQMPPRGKLPEETILAFKEWIMSGAFDPRGGGTHEGDAEGPPTIEDGRQFWAFQPIQRPPVPEPKQAIWPKNDIDRFVLAKLEEQGITPVNDAGRESLIRRLTYDLTGLPPTSEQIADFLEDTSAIANFTLIDRLLESKHFGERWGRHWLDVGRFAESSGGGRTLLFPNAWRYRDYVIDSFNEDLPYDQFLRQQVAGDLLPAETRQQRERNLVATGFLVLGPTNYELQDKDILEMDVIDEQLDTMGKAMLGMTIGCARCHDHKFDPIPTSDYYALAGILKSTHSLNHSNVSKWNTVELPATPEQESVFLENSLKLKSAEESLAAATKVWKKASGQLDAAPASVDPATLKGVVVDSTEADVVGDWTESVSVRRYVGAHYIHDASKGKGSKTVTYRPDLPMKGSYEVFACYSTGNNRSKHVPFHIEHAKGKTTVRVNQRKKPPVDDLMQSLGKFNFDPTGDPRVVISTEGTEDGVVIADAIVWAIVSDSPPEKIVAADSKTEAEAKLLKQETAKLKSEVDRLTAELKALKKATPARHVAMAVRDMKKPADIHLAIRGMTHQKGDLVSRGVMQVASWDSLPPIPSDASGRLELANWIANKKNPLTARVIANRVWHWTMGKGIVASVDNFGSMGDRPTHPELLDHLASSLMENGWSIKKLVREIVSSRTYQLSTLREGNGIDQDPENRLYWRRDRKRLLAEDLRDSMLMAAGSLDMTMGGPSMKKGTSSEYDYQFDGKRRSVYVPVFRNTLPEIFEVFDFADPNIQGGRRTTSTVASQALLLMNHPFVMAQAAQAAKHLTSQSRSSESLLETAFLQVLGRKPRADEQKVMIDLLAATDQTGKENDWALIYQLLFQCIDFRYLD